MDRILPLYEIDGIMFQVDVVTRELVDIENPIMNYIMFNELEDLGSHYVLHWNKTKRNSDTYSAFLDRRPESSFKSDPAYRWVNARAQAEFEEEQKTNIIKIPPMKDLDSVGMSELYNIPLSAINNMTDFEIMVNQDLLLKRKMGVLPILKIGNHSFLVDLKQDIIQRATPSNNQFIPFSKLEEFTKMDGSAYLVPWDFKEGRVLAETNYRPRQNFPDDEQFVIIPSKENLDPYGYYKLFWNEIELHDGLRRIPLKEEIVAPLFDRNIIVGTIFIEYYDRKSRLASQAKEVLKKAKRNKRRGLNAG